MIETSRHEKALMRVMIFGTSLSFGILAAVIVSMKDFIGGNAAFEFSYKTLIGFAAGSFVGWSFWWWVRRRARRDRETKS